MSATPSFEDILPTIGLPEETGEFDETIVPDSMLAPLQVLTEHDRTGDPSVDQLLEGPELQTMQKIGDGGMGIVNLAAQLRLRRQVAVKRIRPERRSAGATSELLREAWLMGSLEHPNVVPVHTLAADEQDGSPVLVMKRIEGTAWNEVLGSEDKPLNWHLNVLSQVCDALRLAHSRGIVHRDIKPHNVMIGAFGEVYLLDWGIAVSLREEDRGRLMVASDASGLAGTPAYLAPEMLTEDGAQVSTATDVYLLGATLHELLTGEPPHNGATLVEILHSAFESPAREYESEIPEELVKICHRAMHREPSERFANAGEFQEALRTYLEHRESTQLARSAEERLGQLAGWLEMMVPESGVDPETTLPAEQGPPPDAATLDRVFNEARFGFQQALEMWPANKTARRGLRHTLEVMARIAVAQKDLKAATRLLSELEDKSSESASASVPADLMQALQELDKRKKAEARRLVELETLERELDITAADKARSRTAILVAVLCVGPGIIAGAMVEAGTLSFSYGILLGLLVAVLVESAIAVWFLRKHLIVNEMSRRIATSWLLLMVMTVIFVLGAQHRGVTLEDTLLALAMMGAVGLGFGVTLVERRAWPLVVLYTGLYALLSAWPDSVVLVFAIANFIAALMLAWIWGRGSASIGTMSERTAEVEN